MLFSELKNLGRGHFCPFGFESEPQFKNYFAENILKKFEPLGLDLKDELEESVQVVPPLLFFQNEMPKNSVLLTNGEVFN